MCAKMLGKTGKEWWHISVDIIDVVMSDFIVVNICICFGIPDLLSAFSKIDPLALVLSAHCTLQKTEIEMAHPLLCMLLANNCVC